MIESVEMKKKRDLLLRFAKDFYMAYREENGPAPALGVVCGEDTSIVFVSKELHARVEGLLEGIIKFEEPFPIPPSGKLCWKCRFFATKDTGYSNVSIENTTCHCLYGLNPEFPCEESYSWENKTLGTRDSAVVRFAENCDKYYPIPKNQQVRLNVEGGELFTAWPQLSGLLASYFYGKLDRSEYLERMGIRCA